MTAASQRLEGHGNPLDEPRMFLDFHFDMHNAVATDLLYEFENHGLVSEWSLI